VVHKDFLQSEQKVDAATYVETARRMAAALEDRENVTARSRPVARSIVARLSGVSASLLHSLRYRPPKQIAADAFDRLCAAMERTAAEQIRIAEHEIAKARARRMGTDDSVFREVEDALARARELIEERK
jgi:hypothetical protein